MWVCAREHACDVYVVWTWNGWWFYLSKTVFILIYPAFILFSFFFLLSFCTLRARALKSSVKCEAWKVQRWLAFENGTFHQYLVSLLTENLIKFSRPNRVATTHQTLNNERCNVFLCGHNVDWLTGERIHEKRSTELAQPVAGTRRVRRLCLLLIYETYTRIDRSHAYKIRMTSLAKQSRILLLVGG